MKDLNARETLIRDSTLRRQEFRCDFLLVFILSRSFVSVFLFFSFTYLYTDVYLLFYHLSSLPFFFDATEYEDLILFSYFIIVSFIAVLFGSFPYS